MSELGAVPTPEESAHLADAKERRSHLLAALLWFAIAVLYTQLPAPLPIVAVPSAMVLWRLYLAFAPTNSLSEKDRQELRQRALTDLRAARRLRAVLRQDMKAHALMRSNLAKMVPEDERATALQVIDTWDREAQAQLADLENVITHLSDR